MHEELAQKVRDAVALAQATQQPSVKEVSSLQEPLLPPSDTVGASPPPQVAKAAALQRLSTSADLAPLEELIRSALASGGVADELVQKYAALMSEVGFDTPVAIAAMEKEDWPADIRPGHRIAIAEVAREEVAAAKARKLAAAEKGKKSSSCQLL